jgi:hypothetical protein
MRQTFALRLEAGWVAESERLLGLILLSMQGKKNDTQILSNHSAPLYIVLVYSAYPPDRQTTQ